VGGDAGEGRILWAEVFSQSLALNATPLNVAPIFRRQMEGHPRAWIFVSATLAVGQEFGHYLGELGLDALDPPVRTAVWGSPFDYPHQAVLYAPVRMPEPNHPDYTAAVGQVALPLIRAARGRCFVLCTSLRAMRRIHEQIGAALAETDPNLPVLLQGEASRSELLQRFRRAGNAVLVASQSFWEGVDVPGDALSVVVIDKLPFAPPDDPVLAARVEHLRRRGLNPFFVHQLPRAVISMKQGAGRLIRSESDRGVLCICDPRMIDKGYGKQVWRSLPPMRRTRVEAEVLDFLARLADPVAGPEAAGEARGVDSAAR
jgi:ATP-dependent DNA helicase DinG